MLTSVFEQHGKSFVMLKVLPNSVGLVPLCSGINGL